MSAPTRRGLLGAVAALPLAAAPAIAVADPNPDAGLLRLCAEFHRQHAVTLAWPSDDDEGHGAALENRWHTAFTIDSVRAKTVAGIKAKAAVAVLLIEENRGAWPEDSDVSIAHAVLVELAEEFTAWPAATGA